MQEKRGPARKGMEPIVHRYGYCGSASHDAYKKEFRTVAYPRTEHLREIALKGEIHNNKMERMNGEVRDGGYTWTQDRKYSDPERVADFPQLRTRA